MDFSRPISDLLQENAVEYFGKDRVFKIGACVCLKPVAYSPFHEMIDFLNTFVKGSDCLNYDIVRFAPSPKENESETNSKINNPFGLHANIYYNSIVVAQLLQN